MSKLAAVLSTIVSLALPAVAGAHHSAQHPTTDPVTLALALAERYWQAVPCDGKVTIGTSALEPATVEVGAGVGHVAMWAPVGGCIVTLNTGYWPNWRSDDALFQLLCDGMTHEAGHLLGYGVDGQSDPASIKYPQIETTTPNYSAVPECQHVTLWYGRERLVG